MVGGKEKKEEQAEKKNRNTLGGLESFGRRLWEALIAGSILLSLERVERVAYQLSGGQDWEK